MVLGRLVCGWLCPFGLIQELLYRIRSHKVRVGPSRLRFLKYGVLAVLVVLMPLLVRDRFRPSVTRGSASWCAPLGRWKPPSPCWL